VLGTAGPVAARPFNLDGQGSFVPAGYVGHYGKANVPAVVRGHMKGLPESTAAPAPTATPHTAVSHPAPGSDLVYVLAGGVVFAVAGVGGTLAATRRRTARTATPGRPRIAG
jgi:hypothetical protein